MDEMELKELARGFLGEAADLSVVGISRAPNLYGIDLPEGYHVLSYQFKNEYRVGSDRYIAIPRSGNQPFLLFEVGE